MAIFTTRVELHNVLYDDDSYEILHTEMEKEGFTRTILKNNVYYKMLSAEYNKVGEYTTSQVLDSAIRASKKTDKKFSILVNNIYGREGYNLEPVSTK